MLSVAESSAACWARMFILWLPIAGHAAQGMKAVASVIPQAYDQPLAEASRRASQQHTRNARLSTSQSLLSQAAGERERESKI